jgi:hypothetical protein
MVNKTLLPPPLHPAERLSHFKINVFRFGTAFAESGAKHDGSGVPKGFIKGPIGQRLGRGFAVRIAGKRGA